MLRRTLTRTPPRGHDVERLAHVGQRGQDSRHTEEPSMHQQTPVRGLVIVAGLLCVLLAGGPFEPASAQPKPEGEMRWALYVTLAPAWFDPAEIGGLTPFWVLYAIHDAVVKPMPGNLLTPSLAESWTVSADQRVYEFKL